MQLAAPFTSRPPSWSLSTTTEDRWTLTPISGHRERVAQHSIPSRIEEPCVGGEGATDTGQRGAGTGYGRAAWKANPASSCNKYAALGSDPNLLHELWRNLLHELVFPYKTHIPESSCNKFGRAPKADFANVFRRPLAASRPPSRPQGPIPENPTATPTNDAVCGPQYLQPEVKCACRWPAKSLQHEHAP